MFKVAICAGHGLNTPGKRTPDGEHEWSFNSKVAIAFMAAMSQYEGVEVKRYDDPTGKTDVPLATRTNGANAWGADIYISFHHNANTGNWGTWTGTETYTYLGSQPKSEKLASCVHPEILKVYGLANRGMKKADFHIVRETHMPAILIEGGYMDSTIDIKKLRDDNVLKNVGYAVAVGVAKYAGLTKKSNPAPTPKPTPAPQPAPVVGTDTYKVIAGDTLWAISKKFGMTVDELKSLNGLKSDTLSIGQILKIKKTAPSNDNFFRVFVDGKQIGAFSVEKNAYDAGWEQYNGGHKDVYLTTPNGSKYVFDAHQADNPKKAAPVPTPVPQPTPTPQPKPEPQPIPAPVPGNAIVGKSVASVEQMVAFVKSKNSNFDGNIASAYIKVGNKYGIRGDIAFCQSIIETGWFKFDSGTAVTPDQHNYAGIGVTSKGIKGNSFNTIEEGVTAQIQHLFAYASKNALPAGETILDPRFNLVTRGIATTWEGLSNRWAMNPNYGANIIALYKQLLTTPIPKPIPTPVPNPVPVPDVPHTPQKTEQKEVFFTATEIQHDHYASVIIDGKGYISASDAAKLLGLKAVYDKLTKEIIFIKE